MTFPGRDTETNASRPRVLKIDRFFNSAVGIYPRSGFSSTPIQRHWRHYRTCQTPLKSQSDGGNIEQGSCLLWWRVLSFWPSFLPQICHRPNQIEKDNGGKLRVTGGQDFVAKGPSAAIFLGGADHLCPTEAIRFHCTTNRVVMQAQLRGDRADRPVLAKEQVTNSGDGFGSNHALPPVGEGIDKAPGPPTEDAHESDGLFEPLEPGSRMEHLRH